MEKLKKLSKNFRIIFQIIFYALPVLLVILWGNVKYIGEGWLSTLIIPASVHIYHKFTVINMFYGFLIDLIPVAIFMLSCHYLIKLFELYEKGIVFSLQNIIYIKKMGWLIAIQQAVHIFIYHPLIAFAMTVSNPFHENVMEMPFSRENLVIVVLGLMIVLIAAIMEEGRKARDVRNYNL